jgi:RNA-binding protein
MSEIIELRRKAMVLEPVIRIGKNGLTEGAIAEIKKLLKKYKLIKIKMLKGFAMDKNKKTVAREIAEKTDSELVQQVGFVVVLYKKD